MSSRVEGSRVQGFKGSRVRGFETSDIGNS
jgi:hypothetical protein